MLSLDDLTKVVEVNELGWLHLCGDLPMFYGKVELIDHVIRVSEFGMVIALAVF
jgi:hypothetical protein